MEPSHSDHGLAMIRLRGVFMPVSKPHHLTVPPLLVSHGHRFGGSAMDCILRIVTANRFTSTEVMLREEPHCGLQHGIAGIGLAKPSGPCDTAGNLSGVLLPNMTENKVIDMLFR